MNWNDIDFDKIINLVEQYALSDGSKNYIKNMKPSSDIEIVTKRLDETFEAYSLLKRNLHIPFLSLHKFETIFKKIEMGYILTPEELVEYADFLRGIRMLGTFFEKWKDISPILYRYSLNFKYLNTLENSIYNTVTKLTVLSSASRELNKCRQRMEYLKQEIDKLMKKALKHPNYKEYLQENAIFYKNDKPTLPIKSAFKYKVKGDIVEESLKGVTTYIVPLSVAKLVDEKEQLRALEETIQYQLLSQLTNDIYDTLTTHQSNAEIITQIDVIFARAKFAMTYDGNRVAINKQNVISLIDARHPLITPFTPLTIELGEKYIGLIITGMNAGGKTVVLKTVGLLTLMTMFGLLVPCHKDSSIAIMDNVFVSIGDNQSIYHSLSTFSAEMTKLSYILKNATEHSLILLDEIGTGTNPKEGIALSIAILNELYRRKTLLLVTTHYGEIKEYAIKNPHFETASMAFDKETLLPKYKLNMHTIGESHAFWVAEKMGILPNIIEKAKTQVATGDFQIPIVTLDNKNVNTIINNKDETVEFFKGDIVYVNTLKKEALFYEAVDMSNMSKIYVDKSFIVVPNKRLKKVRDAKDLYPKNYNLDLLFISDYKSYKFNKDLQRGSKKAWKKYRKDKH